MTFSTPVAFLLRWPFDYEVLEPYYVRAEQTLRRAWRGRA